MFAARAFRRVPVVQACARRAMSGGGHSVEQLQAETVTWKKLSYVMFGVTIAFTVYNVVVNEHPHKREDLPYLKTRTKPFPWQECHDCALFDLDCWAKCRGETTDDDSHH